jgi:tryptophan halogenase
VKRIDRVLVLGGGSAGLMAAVTLKRKLPALDVEVVRSPELGVIGVGEGTTASFPRHFFEYLKLPPGDFYEHAEPTWKLGIRFQWGAKDFDYTFAKEYEQRWPEMRRNLGFYHDRDTPWMGIISACMAHGKAFPRKADGTPHFHNNHAFHVENLKLVGWLEKICRDEKVTITDGTMDHAELDGGEVTALVMKDGRRMTADLYVDASGFRSELLGRALGVGFKEYDRSLFCDRAVIAGWPRADGEPILPYTVAETMDAGWCWQIEHEHWINRGYVYSSRFLSDEEALAEFRRKNPRIANEPRLVKFRSGRYEKLWQGNVVGIGNAAGFVEPLEATALQVICVEVSTLADSLVDSLQEPTPTIIELYNQYNTGSWDDIRDFLAVHYAFNQRLDTPFWRACRAETDLAGAARIVDYFKENGPSVLPGPILIHPSNSFGIDGYLTMLVGQQVPHGKPYAPTAAEKAVWKQRIEGYGQHARRGLSVAESLALLRQRGVKSPPSSASSRTLLAPNPVPRV